MKFFKSHYHHSRLLRDRIRSVVAKEAALPEETSVDSNNTFGLPDYFTIAPEPIKEEDGRFPVIILWDEVA